MEKQINEMFPVERLDFTNKRLPLKHNPKVQSTEGKKFTINQIGRALLKFRRSFIPEGNK